VASFEALLPEGQDFLVEEKQAETLQSMLFLSTADGGYEAQPLPAKAQWGTVQDLWWEEEARQLYFISSNAELMAVHGNSQSARGGVLGDYDAAASAFQTVQSLDLPRGVQARALLPVSGRQLLLITNNDYPYLLSSR
jgi:hypothetical protein